MENYLLDTNALFSILKIIIEKKVQPEIIKKILSSNCYISQITKIEIISVIGKYSRGSQKQKYKCNSYISENNDICTNYCYKQEEKKWKNNLIKMWLKLLDEIFEGKNQFLTVKVLPVNENVLAEATRFIEHSLLQKFGSMDSVIAATVKVNIIDKGEIIVITADKALKAALAREDLKFIDINDTVTFL